MACRSGRIGVGADLDEAPQVGKCSGLEGLDRADPSARDPGDVAQGKIGHEPEGDDVALLRRELVERLDELAVDSPGLRRSGRLR